MFKSSEVLEKTILIKRVNAYAILCELSLTLFVVPPIISEDKNNKSGHSVLYPIFLSIGVFVLILNYTKVKK